MDKEIKFLAEKVLKRETNTILKEIERLMTEDGVGEVLTGEMKNSQEKGKDKKQGKVPGRKQFIMLMEAAGEASCIEELLLFLSYQKSKNHGWGSLCDNQKDIAQNLVDSFMKVQDEIFGSIVKEAGAKKICEEDERILRLEIAEKYMGYLYWKASVVGGFKEGE